jgi:hypothetical protein
MARKKAGKKKARFGKKSREWRSKKNAGGARYLNALPDGFEFFKPKGGKKYTFDILPYVVKNPEQHPAHEAINEDGLFWCLPYRLHKNVGPNDLLVVCPKSVGRNCCICDERAEVYNDPNRDDEEAKPLNSSARTLFIVKMLKGPDKGEIKVLDISDYCFLDAMEEELDDLPEEYEDFACLEDGYSLEVRFKEAQIGKTIKFAKASKVSFIERKEDYDESILDEVPCLDDLITWPTSEKMEKLFYGADDTANTDDDDDEEESTEEEKEESNDLDWDDLLEMKKDELIEVIETEELDIDEDDADDASEDELRDFIAQELGIKKPIKKTKKEKKGKKENKKEKKVGKGKKKDETKSTKKALKCPFAYQFGVDFEEHDECDEDECEMYEQCLDAFEDD